MAQFERLVASEAAQRHMLEKHNVSFEEVIEAAEGDHKILRARSGPGGQRRYLLVGKAHSGRRLMVILADTGGNSMRAITARSPKGKNEIRQHKRTLGE